MSESDLETPQESVEPQATTSPAESFQSKLPIVIAILAIIAVVLAARDFFLDPNSKKIPDRAFSGPIVGEIISVEGQVLIRPPRGTRFEAAKPGPYWAESVLQTQAASAAVIEFRPGPTLRILENSRLVAEVDAAREETVQATILAGEVTVQSAGAASSASQFTLMHNGVSVPFQDGDNPISRTVPLIHVGPGLDDPTVAAGATDLDEKLEIEKESELASAPNVDIDATNSTPTPATKNANDNRPRTLPTKVPTSASGLVHSTLTNDDIRTQVRAQAGSFQKCYVTMVNRMSESKVSVGALPKGETLVSFKIQPTGKVEEQRVIRSPFKDATFERCIAEAIGRLRFRQFQGAAIPVGEFPIVLE